MWLSIQASSVSSLIRTQARCAQHAHAAGLRDFHYHVPAVSEGHQGKFDV